MRESRRRLGLSQEELADRSGITVRGLRKIESGKIITPRPVTVRLLAEALGLSGDDRAEFCAAAHRQPGAVASASPAIPAQLPAEVTGFVGRTGPLLQLDALLSAGAGQPPVKVVTVAGPAGVGKTTLAVHWAHRVRHRFPDGQLYLDLRGFASPGTTLTPAEAIQRFLGALHIPPSRIPSDAGAQIDLYRSMLADRRMLVVLDNARDPEQVKPLLPGAAGCLVVVTSRTMLTGLVASAGAYPMPLDLLTDEEARALLTCRLGSSRVQAEPEAVAEIIACCARLPLALAVVAASAATQPRRSLAALADHLRHSRNRLGALSTGDSPATDVRAVFSWSYGSLEEGAARLFRLLGLHPGPSFSAAAAASCAALPLTRAQALLAELSRVHLLNEHASGRYSFHDLLHAYAAELAHGIDAEDDRRQATHRVLDHYVHTANAASHLLEPARDPIPLRPPSRGAAPEQLTDHDQALAWFTGEHAVLVAAVDHAAAHGLDTHCWQLAWALWTFLDRRGHWQDWAATGRAAVAAADRLADPAAQARTNRLVAWAYTMQGHHDLAHAHLRQALDLYQHLGDEVGEAYSHYNLDYLWWLRGDSAQALYHADRALALFRSANHQAGQANALNTLGWYHSQLGDHRQALAACRQALALQQGLGDRRGQAHTWDSLGHAHHHLRHHTQAVACYRQAIDLFRGLGDRYQEASVLTHLGDAHHSTGSPGRAHAAWQAALSVLDQLDHPDAGPLRAKLAGLHDGTSPTSPAPLADQ